MICCWGREERGQGWVSEDLGSQLEPGCLPTANLGAGAPSGCSETPLGGGAGLGPAGSAYKWPREERCPISKPLISCWSCLVHLDPVTQAFWSPFLGEAVASLGKMPECWDGVSEGSGAARGSGPKGIPQPMSGGESAFSRLTWSITEARPAGPRLPGDPGLPCSGVAASPPGRGGVTSAENGMGCDLSASLCGPACQRVYTPRRVCPPPGTCPAGVCLAPVTISALGEAVRPACVWGACACTPGGCPRDPAGLSRLFGWLHRSANRTDSLYSLGVACSASWSPGHHGASRAEAGRSGARC